MLEQAAKRLGAKTQEYAFLGGISIVRGSADIVWDDAVWDVKCVGDYAWRKAKKEPDPKHVTQVSSYAIALGRPKWVLLYIYLGSIGKGRTLQYVFHEGDADPAIAKQVVDHWLAVRTFADKGELPARPFQVPAFECSVCSYEVQCWENETHG